MPPSLPSSGFGFGTRVKGRHLNAVLFLCLSASLLFWGVRLNCGYGPELWGGKARELLALGVLPSSSQPQHRHPWTHCGSASKGILGDLSPGHTLFLRVFPLLLYCSGFRQCSNTVNPAFFTTEGVPEMGPLQHLSAQVPGSSADLGWMEAGYYHNPVPPSPWLCTHRNECDNSLTFHQGKEGRGVRRTHLCLFLLL